MPKCHKLTLWQEDFPANHLVLPGSVKERKMTVISSQKWLDLLPRSSPVGLLAKMLLGHQYGNQRITCWIGNCQLHRTAIYYSSLRSQRTV